MGVVAGGADDRAALPSDVQIMIATPLEAALVDRIAAVLPNIDVWYEPELLPAARFPSDHRGVDGFERTAAGEARWQAALGRAEILYGVPGDTGAGLARAVPAAPALRWVQGTAAGAGEQVRGAKLNTADLTRITFTSAAGVHGGMLAEFAFYGLLAIRKEQRRLEALRTTRTWEHFAMDELDGSTIAVIGMGSIGQAIARRARAFGMRVIGIARTAQPHRDADEMVAIADLSAACARAQTVVVTLPLTERTRGLIDRATIASWTPETVFINVGRGAVVDQVALTQALANGTLGGAVLDVFEVEPLPADDPLWTLPNVIFSPHTAALSVRENERIVALFCDNIRRFAAGESLQNIINISEFY